jgi:hypothetical protein
MSGMDDTLVQRDRQSGQGVVMVHLYPHDPAFRLSGQPEPQPGDIARCGHVKRLPHMPAHGPGPNTCVVCIEMSRNAGLYPW